MTSTGNKEGGGIVPGHAYSILKVIETSSKIKLINLRNPWGQFEWDGDFCDNSPSWTKSLLEEIKPTFNESDGSFWMSWDDFKLYF